MANGALVNRVGSSATRLMTWASGRSRVLALAVVALVAITAGMPIDLAPAAGLHTAGPMCATADESLPDAVPTERASFFTAARLPLAGRAPSPRVAARQWPAFALEAGRAPPAVPPSA